MDQSSHQLDGRTLREFLLGKLDPEQSLAVESYLQTHPVEAAQIQDEEIDDILVKALRSPTRMSYVESAELTKLANQLTELPQQHGGAEAFAPATPEQTATHDGPNQREHEDFEDPLVILSPPRSDGEIGRLGGYRVLRLLGEGGMGVVFEAIDEALDRHVALKAMKPRIARRADSRERFTREARAAAAVEHPNVIAIFHVHEDRGIPFLAMPMLKGEPLNERLKREKPLLLTLAMEIGRQMALGLAAAHKNGLIHRDIKPANIWLEPGDSDLAPRVRILDFGLARTSTHDIHLTQSGAVMGTPAYMAPEQARSHVVDQRADLFSLGVTLYEMTTGMRPFTGNDAMSVLLSLGMDTPQAPNQVQPSVPQALSDLIMQLLEKDPANRPQGASDVASRLNRLLLPTIENRTEIVPNALVGPWEGIDESRETPLASPVASQPETTHSVKKKRPWPSIGLGFISVAMLAAVVVVIIRDKDGKKIAEINIPEGHKVEIVDVAPKDKSAKKDAPPTLPKTEAKTFPPLQPEWLAKMQGLDGVGQSQALKLELKRRNPGFDANIHTGLSKGEIESVEFLTDEVEDITPLQALRNLKWLKCEGTEPGKGKLRDISILKGMALNHLSVRNNGLSDLLPLAGMPLEEFDCGGNPIADVGPLSRMPLRSVICDGTQVSDLTPLKGMTLNFLDCSGSQIRDLTPLHDMKLEGLFIGGTKVTDLTPLKGMPLRRLHCPKLPITDLSPLKGCKLTLLDMASTNVQDLTPLQGMSIAELNLAQCGIRDLNGLKRLPLKVLRLEGVPLPDLSILKSLQVIELHCDFHRFRDAEMLKSIASLQKINGTPAAEFRKQVEADQVEFDAWVKRVRDMPAKEQVHAVVKELTRLNPRFNGKVTPSFVSDKVVGFQLQTIDVTDISPVRALPHLKSLECSGSGMRGRLTDLSPLRGMQLTELHAAENQLTTILPLKGMPLEILKLDWNPINELAPLADMPLHYLVCNGTEIADLTPLKNSKLTHLGIGKTRVSSLAPLTGMKLKYLNGSETPISDWTPLKGMPLENVMGAFDLWRDTDLLKSLTNLEQINWVPGAKLWQQFDDQRRKFDAWVSKVEEMKEPRDQLNSVVDELKRRNPDYDGTATPNIQYDRVIGLKLVTDRVSDISPVRALQHLKSLECIGSAEGKGRLSNFWPLRGLRLSSLSIEHNAILDLSPLESLPLKSLQLGKTFNAQRDWAILKKMEMLEQIDGVSKADFFKKIESKK